MKALKLACEEGKAKVLKFGWLGKGQQCAWMAAARALWTRREAELMPDG